MANLERLTKRVKTIEKWIEENEDMGGPKGTLETMTFLVNELRASGAKTTHYEQTFNDFRSIVFDFLKMKELNEEWDAFLQEKDNAIQEQETESVSVRDEPEASEGVREEDAKEQETTE